MIKKTKLMENLIKDYGLTLYKGPCLVYGLGFSLDKTLEESQFFKIVASPNPSYDVMFPTQRENFGWLNLFLFEYDREISTPNFLKSLEEYPDLRLVGVYGMVLFAEKFYVHIPEDKNIVSPAYQISGNGRILGTDQEAHVPYFQLDSDGKVAVKYSRSNASSFFHPGQELILIGQRTDK